MNEPLLTALVTLAGILATAGVSYFLGHRRAITEPAKQLANGYSQLVDDQRLEIKDLRDHVHCLEEKIDKLTSRTTELETEVDRLRKENTKLGRTAEQMRSQLMS